MEPEAVPLYAHGCRIFENYLTKFPRGHVHVVGYF
jgi:hypothetical protein